MIRIPYSKRRDAEPLKRCIEATALQFAMSEQQVALVMARFLEAIADEVTHGRAVVIPGFGMFTQARYKRNGWHWRPAFYASKAYRDQTRFGTSPDPDGMRQRDLFIRNQSRRDEGKRTFMVLRRFRESIAAQLGPQ